MPLANAQDYPLWANALIFLLAAAVVWEAGTRLTRYTDSIAEITGMGQAFAGMLLLGVITSLPEVANVVTASVTGNPRLAINNLLGSASINIVLLAVVDAFVGQEAITAKVAHPSTLMMGVLCMLVLSVVAIAIAATDVGLWGMGLWAAVICALSIGAFWLASGYDDRTQWGLKGHDYGPGRRGRNRDASASDALRPLLARTAIAGSLIFIAGYALSQTGDAIAEQTGIGTGMVGFALIGAATSLPELVTIIESVRLRRYEMAFGQVLGTNFVNLSLIALGDAFFTGGPVINELGRFEIIAVLLGVVLIGVFQVGLLERRNPTIMRMGYDSLLVMALFAGGLILLYSVR